MTRIQWNQNIASLLSAEVPPQIYLAISRWRPKSARGQEEIDFPGSVGERGKFSSSFSSTLKHNLLGKEPVRDKRDTGQLCEEEIIYF